ncbi:MAG TPA: CPBP family intramembrane glutamic endopeptidase [Kribbella sp.]|nr:CPBP family intramembrane glutamic endopeptidase [Kribbella sp.]
MRRHHLLSFVLLLFALSLPFWAAAFFLSSPDGTPMALPVSALQFVCPGLTAVILTCRHSGRAGVRGLLSRVLDLAKIRPLWYAPTVLLVPAIALVTAALTGRSVTLPSLAAVPILLIGFLLAAAAEEVGWMAYAADPLRARRGAVITGLVLGSIWGIWHVIPLVQADRGWGWIAGWFLGTVAGRVIIVWIYDHTAGSVAAAIIYHGMLNIMGSLAPIENFPVAGVVTALVAAAVIMTEISRREAPAAARS